MTNLTRIARRALLATTLLGGSAAVQSEEATAEQSPIQAKIQAKLAEHGCTQPDVDAIIERLGQDAKGDILAVYRGEANDLPDIPSGDPEADGKALQASVDFAKCVMVTDALKMGVAADIRRVAEAAQEDHPKKGPALQLSDLLADSIELPAARDAAKTPDKEAGNAALEAARACVLDVIQAEQAAVQARAASDAIGMPSLEGN